MRERADSWWKPFELLLLGAWRRIGRQLIYLVEHELEVTDANDQKVRSLHSNNTQSQADYEFIYCDPAHRPFRC